MTSTLRSFLAELDQLGRDNDAVESDRAKRMLNLEPDTAELLSLLARCSGAKRVLEIGTSNGYSTLWLAWAISNVGGRVVTIERSADKQKMARANLEKAGLAGAVDFWLGTATDVVRELIIEPGDPFDFVFFDADRITAPEQLKLIVPRLASRAIIAADNCLSHPEEIAGYLDAIKHLPGVVQHAVVPVGKGLSVAYLENP
jgi:predicted O-methyltransferase YrrM